MSEWKYSIRYHRDGNSVVLYQEPFWASALKLLITNRPMMFVVGYVPGAYGLWNKLLFWLDSKEDVILDIPATTEMLKKLAPDDDWLWGEEGETGDGSASAGGS